MTTQTIAVQFDPTDLPEWAQKDSAVVERCKSDLSFRGDVYNAETTQRRNFLRHETRRLQDQRENES